MCSSSLPSPANEVSPGLAGAPPLDGAAAAAPPAAPLAVFEFSPAAWLLLSSLFVCVCERVRVCIVLCIAPASDHTKFLQPSQDFLE